MFSRRAFIKQTTLSMMALSAGAPLMRRVRGSDLANGEIPLIRSQLLGLVNDERAAAGAAALKLDDFASRIAERHAVEMAQHAFLSHWGLDGRKPYHRYSFAGGVDAIEENDGATDHGVPISSEELVADVIGLHKAMHDEVPPNDGHRRTILSPQHTHVGFGIASRGLHVRLSEIYVAKYVTVDPYPAKAKPRSKIIFSGRILDPAYAVQNIDVFYEELPSPPEMSWLQTPRPYGLPDQRETLLPKLPMNIYYEDGSKGTIELHGRGRFYAPVPLSRRQPGIYTIVVWIQKPKVGAPFPATQVCVRTE